MVWCLAQNCGVSQSCGKTWQTGIQRQRYLPSGTLKSKKLVAEDIVE